MLTSAVAPVQALEECSVTKAQSEKRISAIRQGKKERKEKERAWTILAIKQSILLYDFFNLWPLPPFNFPALSLMLFELFAHVSYLNTQPD